MTQSTQTTTLTPYAVGACARCGAHGDLFKDTADVLCCEKCWYGVIDLALSLCEVCYECLPAGKELFPYLTKNEEIQERYHMLWFLSHKCDHCLKAAMKILKTARSRKRQEARARRGVGAKAKSRA